MKYYNNVSTLLEVQAQTKDERNGTGEDVATDATEYLGIDAIILGDAEHVAGSSINTATDAVVAATLEQVVEAVTQSDIVTLEEGSILYPVVTEDSVVVIGLPTHLGRSHRTVVQIETADFLKHGCATHVVVALHHVVEQVVADAGTQAEAEVPVLPVQT